MIFAHPSDELHVLRCSETLSYILNPIACKQRQRFLKIGVTVVKDGIEGKAQMTICDSIKVFGRIVDMVYVDAIIDENLYAEAKQPVGDVAKEYAWVMIHPFTSQSLQGNSALSCLDATAKPYRVGDACP